jgi:hypothetical protein
VPPPVAGIRPDGSPARGRCCPRSRQYILIQILGVAAPGGAVAGRTPGGSVHASARCRLGRNRRRCGKCRSDAFLPQVVCTVPTWSAVRSRIGSTWPRLAARRQPRRSCRARHTRPVFYEWRAFCTRVRPRGRRPRIYPATAHEVRVAGRMRSRNGKGRGLPLDPSAGIPQRSIPPWVGTRRPAVRPTRGGGRHIFQADGCIVSRRRA